MPGNGQELGAALVVILTVYVVLCILVYKNNIGKLFSVNYSESKLIDSSIGKHGEQVSHNLGQGYPAVTRKSNDGDSKHDRTYLPKISNTSDGLRKHTVLIWTSFFVDKIWSFRSDNDPFKNSYCSYDNCNVTYDKTQYASADVILFHCRDPIGGWPAGRPRDQLYGVFCLESAVHSHFGQYGDKINITLSYRRDSDVFTPYHQIILRNQLNSSSSSTLDQPDVPLIDRTRDVVWPVSHCVTRSERETYAEELGKYINIDIFGSCGTHRCPRNTFVSPPIDTHCQATFRHRYKYYLSFENSYCTDYVTEKFFKAYWMELIPVVFGRTDYKKYYPPHSFIDIRDYVSPKHLADYLQYLSTNETAFNEYFEWKRTYVVHRAYWFESMYCGLCKIMNDKTYKKSYPDPQVWWTNGSCDNTIMSEMKKRW